MTSIPPIRWTPPAVTQRSIAARPAATTSVSAAAEAATPAPVAAAHAAAVAPVQAAAIAPAPPQAAPFATATAPETLAQHLLTAEEREFFAARAALGALTYRPRGTAAQPAAPPTGQRVDVRG